MENGNEQIGGFDVGGGGGSPSADTGIDSQIEAIRKSEDYNNPMSRKHDAAMAQMTELYKQKSGDATVFKDEGITVKMADSPALALDKEGRAKLKKLGELGFDVKEVDMKSEITPERFKGIEQLEHIGEGRFDEFSNSISETASKAGWTGEEIGLIQNVAGYMKYLPEKSAVRERLKGILCQVVDWAYNDSINPKNNEEKGE